MTHEIHAALNRSLVEIEDLFDEMLDENEKLRNQITTLKKTISAILGCKELGAPQLEETTKLLIEVAKLVSSMTGDGDEESV